MQIVLLVMLIFALMDVVDHMIPKRRYVGFVIQEND